MTITLQEKNLEPRFHKRFEEREERRFRSTAKRTEQKKNMSKRNMVEFKVRRNGREGIATYVWCEALWVADWLHCKQNLIQAEATGQGKRKKLRPSTEKRFPKKK